jgi:hypothetical protein
MSLLTVNSCPYVQHEGVGEVELQFHSYLTSSLDGGEW